MAGSLLKKCIVAALVIACILAVYWKYSDIRREGARMEQDLQRIQKHLQKDATGGEPAGYAQPSSRPQ